MDRSGLAAIHDRLIAARAAVGGPDSVAERAQRALAELERARAEEQTARDLVAQARREVQSVSGFFGALRGNREARRADAEAALARAEQRAAGTATELARAQAALAKFEAEAPALLAAEQQWFAVLEEKRQAILRLGGPAREELAALGPRIEALMARVKEIEEALVAGHEARDALDRLCQKLDSTRQLGVADMVLGGIMLNAGKFSEMQSARAAAQRVAEAMVKFRKEVGDVDRGAYAPDVGMLATVLDFGFDSLLAELWVQGRVNEARDNAEQTRLAVRDALGRLEAERVRDRAELEKSYRRQIEIVETAV